MDDTGGRSDGSSNIWVNNNNTYTGGAQHNASYSVTNNFNGSKEDRLQRAQESQNTFPHRTFAVELTRGESLELESRISQGAAHNSAERSQWYTPKCAKGTRKAVQSDMLSWIARGKEKVFWLTGPAGAGKSAIAGSVADRAYLFPTLAYHFTHLGIPGLREEILAAIDACPSVFDKNLDEQLDTLILKPLRKVGQGVIQSSTFKTIIVDGVDECKEDRGKASDTEQDRRKSKKNNHREIISSLVRASKDPSFPFRIIIASRPERAIERCFDSFENAGIKLKRVFLDKEYEPQADIELFLRARLDTIGRDHGLPDQWYLKLSKWQDVPRYLAWEASGQFIYAETVIRYVQDGTETPHDQLKRVLDWEGEKSSRPFAALDALYTGILKGTPDPALSVKWTLANALVHPHWNPQYWYREAVLESSPGQIEVALGGLTALVGLINEHGQPAFTLYHKSLLDFLDDKDRSGDLHLEHKAVIQFLRERHYQVLKNRGPQGHLSPDLLRIFYGIFYESLRSWIDYNREFNTRDVDWWITLHDNSAARAYSNRLEDMKRCFESVHSACRWYHCLPSCKMWRKGIIRYLEGIGHPVPTPFDLFRAKFGRWKHLGSIPPDRETIEFWNAVLQPRTGKLYKSGKFGKSAMQRERLYESS
ncbi:hypothetical protein NMY22_g13151 [Coprinellus aureogranulatus]|nr:hypothetical protein NMY22_g13151 [Coprinellus aureogranulatus]